ncbi:ABC transporter permease [Microvirga makkahensis]|uniref:ABC transporter permease subunit n=1 Tax=Microvirga makkahensis TaxID=1128670 RepID=A0A7X3MWD7_9HYPH|nr:ABC transporter permease [Microvirga makkahensis]MXQ14467.1 ABC transporter permease subunit [Microvirga makkahensis]
MSDQAATFSGAIPDTVKTERSRSFWQAVFRRLSRDPLTMICAAILLAIVLIAIFAPWIAPNDPYKTSMVRRLKPPGTPGYWLGTDELGRDMLSRLIYGGRLSLFMGFTPVVVATFIGGTLGVIAGYAGGRINMAIMRLIDVFYAFPSVLLAVAISGALGAGIVNGLVSLILVFIPPIARVAESVTTQVRTQDFIEAARATGASGARIVTGHVLSNVVGPILIYASSLISVSIVIASGLSFLGLGVSPPLADWGLMLNTLRQSIYIAPVNAVLPGVMIFTTSMCFNLMSDGLRSAMDVKG